MDTGLEELLQSFKEETEEIFESVDMNFLFLEKDPSSEDLINSIFRSIHTLKGSAGMMGMEKTNKLAHALEDVLDKIRSKELSCTPELLNLFFGIVDCLKELVQLEMTGAPVPNDYLGFIQELKEVLAEEKGASASAAGKFSIDAQLSEEIRSFQSKGLNVYKLEIPFDELCMMKSSGAFLAVNNIEEYGKIFKIFPPVDDPAIEDSNSFIIILATESEETEELLEAAEIPGMTEDPSAKLIEPGELESQQEASNSGDSGSTSKEEDNKDNFFIRIPVDKIESMMSLIDELFLGKSQFSSVVIDIAHKNPSHPILKTLGDLTRNMDKLTSSIQKMVIDIRRIPIEMELLKCKRHIRDLTRKYNKEVKMVVDSKDVEIDRELWKKIDDSINLILEKSVSLSIESAEQRSGMGKDETGIIRISVSYSDSDIILEICDDGEGIPDDSTEWTEKIKDSIKSMNGKFSLINDQDENMGFKCRLQIPSNSSKIDVFFFRISGITYAIPASCVNEIVKLPQQDIKTIKGEEVIVHRNNVISILNVENPYWITEEMEYKNGNKVLCIIIADTEKTVAIPVDEVIGEDEILIKKFDNTIIDSEYVIGATVLGDGKVVPILNSASMISSGRLLLSNQ